MNKICFCPSVDLGLYYGVAQDPLWRVPRPRHPLRQLPAGRREANGVRGLADRPERRDPDFEGGRQLPHDPDRPPVDGHDL